jgi:short subunit fatty acids transporter
MVTPNVLTETSNLLDYHDEPERTRLFQHLREVISNSTDLLVESVVASATEEFPRFGLCDSAVLLIASPDRQVLTMDRALHGLCNKEVPNSSVLFHGLRFLTLRHRRHR